ncbi:MAG: NADH:flavin oxidoreductase [Thermoplasmata archaeon]|nr:NADH:flavin oxidoreductase [Thermoplasmata archaeon]
MNDSEAELLDQKIRIGSAEIRNRFVRSATHEWLASPDGTPTEEIGNIYERLAIGRVGLIISGYSYISSEGKGSEGQQGMHGDHVIPAYREISDRIHRCGSTFFAQLVHTGRHAFPTKKNPRPLSPSELPIPKTEIISKEMSEREIQEVIDDYLKAIDRARRCGIDGVQIHCAHGFLLSSFLSPFLNRREDDWGGDTERRSKIVVEILSRAKKLFPEYPIAVKMNSFDGVDGGIEEKEAVAIAKILCEEKIDAIEVSGGIEEAPIDVTCQKAIVGEKEAYFKEQSKAIKSHVECLVMLVGGLRSIGVMAEMIKGGFADMISMSRPLIREPDIVAKLIAGRKEDATCVSCNRCHDTTGIKCNHGKRQR